MDLTIDDFAQWNYRIAIAYAIGACDSTSDLNNWPPISGSSGCDTPNQCLCNVNSIENEIYGEVDFLFNRQCIKCKCTSNGYNCTAIQSTSDPNEYSSFNCPQTVKCLDGASTYSVGDGWFWSKNCTRFCYCGKDGKSHTADDFVSIMNNEDSVITDTFTDYCGVRILEVTFFIYLLLFVFT